MRLCGSGWGTWTGTPSANTICSSLTGRPRRTNNGKLLRTNTPQRVQWPQPAAAQNKSRQSVRTTASLTSGGHGTRTRNRFPGTSFPVRPLAIRLPSGGIAWIDEKLTRANTDGLCLTHLRRQQFALTATSRAPATRAAPYSTGEAKKSLNQEIRRSHASQLPSSIAGRASCPADSTATSAMGKDCARRSANGHSCVRRRRQCIMRELLNIAARTALGAKLVVTRI